MDNTTIIQELIESTEEHDDDQNNESNFMFAMNAILSGTARLNVLLPTAPILSFTIFTPLHQRRRMHPLQRWLTAFFIALSAASCIFFSFTDSFKTATGRLYYGVATFRGIWSFNGGRNRPRMPSDYRLRWADPNSLPLVVGFVVTVLFVSSPSKRRGIGYLSCC